MADNRLEIRIAARTEQFERALKQLQANVKSSSAGIAKAFENAGDGVDVLDKAIGEIEGAFAKSTKEGESALAGLQDKASKTGQDIREAFIKAGKSVDEAEQETEQFINALRDFSKAKGDIDQLGKSFKDVEDAAKGAKNATDQLSKIQIAEKLADGVGQLSENFDEAGGRARDLRRDIKLAFSNPKDAEKYIKVAEGLREEFGTLLDQADFGKAAKRLDTLGAASEKNFTRIAKLALDTGKDFDDAADDLGEFLAPIESGNADFAILDETLRSSFGIAAKALKEYGAEVDTNGKLIARTRDQQLKAQEALRKYIDENERFANISKRSKDGQDKLTDSLDRFNTSVGDQVNIIKNELADGIFEYVDLLNGLSDNTKAAIGITSELAGGFASIGVKTLETAAYFKLAGGNLTPLTKGLQALAARAGLSVVALGGVAAVIAASVGVIAYTVVEYNKMTEAMEKQEKALISLENTQRKVLNDDRAKYVSKSIDAIEAETGAIEDSGKRRAAITDAIIAKQAAADEYQRGGFTERAAQLKAEVDSLGRLRQVYDTDAAAVAKAEKEKTAARERAYQDSVEAFNEFKLAVQRGEFESNEAALKQIQSIASGLSGDDLKAANAEKRKFQKDALKDQVDNLKAEVEERKKSADESKKIFAELLKSYESRGQDRVALEREFTEFLKSEGDKRFQQEQQNEARRIALKQQSIALAKSASNPELAALEKRLQKGEDVEAQLKKEYNDEAANLKILAEKTAQIEKLIIAREKEAAIREASQNNDPDSAKAAAEFAAEAQKQVDAKLAQEKAAIDKALADKREKLDEEFAKKKAARDAKSSELVIQNLEVERAKQEQNFADRRRQLDEEARLGVDVSQRRLDLEKEVQDFNRASIEERLKAELDLIKAKRDASNVGASQSQQDLNNKQAELDIQKAIQKSKQDTQQINDQELSKAREKTAEIQKQIEEQKKLNEEKKKEFGIESSFGSVSGVDKINEFGGGFGQSRKAKPEDQQGPTEEELKRQLTLAKVAEIQAAEKVNASGSKDRTRAINEAARQSPTSAKDPNQSAAQAFSQEAAASATQALAQTSQQSLNYQQQLLAEQKQQNALLKQFLTQQGRNSNPGQNFTRGQDDTLF